MRRAILLDPPGMILEDSAVHPGLRWRTYAGRRPRWETQGELWFVTRLVYSAAAILSLAAACVALFGPR